VSRPPFRVLVWHRAPAGQPDAVQRAYRAARDGLAGVPGYAGDELLRSTAGDGRYLLVMHWRDESAFTAWERAHRRAGHPSPLRQFAERDRPGGHVARFAVLGEC
jgi:heme oxygenase (mycobilin-producing)